MQDATMTPTPSSAASVQSAPLEEAAPQRSAAGNGEDSAASRYRQASPSPARAGGSVELVALGRGQRAPSGGAERAPPVGRTRSQPASEVAVEAVRSEPRALIPGRTTCRPPPLSPAAASDTSTNAAPNGTPSAASTSSSLGSVVFVREDTPTAASGCGFPRHRTSSAPRPGAQGSPPAGQAAAHVQSPPTAAAAAAALRHSAAARRATWSTATARQPPEVAAPESRRPTAPPSAAPRLSAAIQRPRVPPAPRVPASQATPAGSLRPPEAPPAMQPPPPPPANTGAARAPSQDRRAEPARGTSLGSPNNGQRRSQREADRAHALTAPPAPPAVAPSRATTRGNSANMQRPPAPRLPLPPPGQGRAG